MWGDVYVRVTVSTDTDTLAADIVKDNEEDDVLVINSRPISSTSLMSSRNWHEDIKLVEDILPSNIKRRKSIALPSNIKSAKTIGQVTAINFFECTEKNDIDSDSDVQFMPVESFSTPLPVVMNIKHPIIKKN
jgi:hypothetical protein